MKVKACKEGVVGGVVTILPDGSVRIVSHNARFPACLEDIQLTLILQDYDEVRQLRKAFEFLENKLVEDGRLEKE